MLESVQKRLEDSGASDYAVGRGAVVFCIRKNLGKNGRERFSANQPSNRSPRAGIVVGTVRGGSRLQKKCSTHTQINLPPRRRTPSRERNRGLETDQE